MVASDPPPSYSSSAPSTTTSHRSHKSHRKSSDIEDEEKDNSESIGAHQPPHVRGKYSPEFLKDFASKHKSSSGDVLLEGTKLKLLSGPDATQFASEYLKTVKSHHTSQSKSVAKPTPTNIVFAMPTLNSVGRKALDFYMANATDIPKTHALKGTKRRKNFLDKEFNKINEAVTKEYKRMSAMLSTGLEEKPAESVKKGSPLVEEVAVDPPRDEGPPESRPDDKGEGPSRTPHHDSHRPGDDVDTSSRREGRSEGRRRRHDRSSDRRHRRDPDPDSSKDKEAHDRTTAVPPTLPEASPASEDVIESAPPRRSRSRRSRRDEEREEDSSRRRSRRSEEGDSESRHDESGRSRRSRRHEQRRDEERTQRRDSERSQRRDVDRSRRHNEERSDRHEEERSHRHDEERSDRREEERSERDDGRRSERRSGERSERRESSKDARRSRRHRDRRGDDDTESRSRRSGSRERRRRDDSKESRATRRSERRRSRSRDKDRSERREKRERRAREREREKEKENVKQSEEKTEDALVGREDVEAPEDFQNTIKARRPTLVTRGSVMSLPFLSEAAAGPASIHGMLQITNPDALSTHGEALTRLERIREGSRYSLAPEDDEVPEEDDLKGKRHQFDASASAETLVDSEHGKGSTASLPVVQNGDAPTRKASKFSMKSILKKRQSKIGQDLQKLKSRDNSTTSLPEDADYDAEVTLVLLDEKEGNSPWKQLQSQFKRSPTPVRRPSKANLFGWLKRSKSSASLCECGTDCEEHSNSDSSSCCSLSEDEVITDDEDDPDVTYLRSEPKKTYGMGRSYSARAGWPGADGPTPVMPVCWTPSNRSGDGSEKSYHPFSPAYTHGKLPPAHFHTTNSPHAGTTSMPTSPAVFTPPSAGFALFHRTGSWGQQQQHAGLQSPATSVHSTLLGSPSAFSPQAFQHPHLHRTSSNTRKPASQSELDAFVRNSPYNIHRPPAHGSATSSTSGSGPSSPWASQSQLSASSPMSAHSNLSSQWGVPNTPVWKYSSGGAYLYPSTPSTPGRSATY